MDTKKQKEYREIIPQFIKPTYIEGPTLPYLERKYPLRVVKNQAEYSIKFLDGDFTVGIKLSRHSRLRSKSSMNFKDFYGVFKKIDGAAIAQ